MASAQGCEEWSKGGILCDMETVEILSGRWDGLRLDLPLEGKPKKLEVTDDGLVVVDEIPIGTVKELTSRI